MSDSPSVPLALKVVAVLFLVGGIFAVFEVIIALSDGRISINLGVLGLFIGPGLLMLSPGWRTCALVLLWIGLIGIPVVWLIMLSHPGPLDLTVLGRKVGKAPKELGLLMGVVLFGFVFWQYRVLTRPDIRDLFYRTEPTDDSGFDEDQPG